MMMVVVALLLLLLLLLLLKQLLLKQLLLLLEPLQAGALIHHGDGREELQGRNLPVRPLVEETGIGKRDGS